MGKSPRPSRLTRSLGSNCDHLAVVGAVIERCESAHGQKYVVDGLLMSHTGENRSRPIRTVWIVEPSTGVPRLVTAYPREE